MAAPHSAAQKGHAGRGSYARRLLCGNWNTGVRERTYVTPKGCNHVQCDSCLLPRLSRLRTIWSTLRCTVMVRTRSCHLELGPIAYIQYYAGFNT